MPRQIGVVLRKAILETEVPCSYGVDEFVLALPGAALVRYRAKSEGRSKEEIMAADKPGNVPSPTGAALEMVG